MQMKLDPSYTVIRRGVLFCCVYCDLNIMYMENVLVAPLVFKCQGSKTSTLTFSCVLKQKEAGCLL